MGATPALTDEDIEDIGFSVGKGLKTVCKVVAWPIAWLAGLAFGREVAPPLQSRIPVHTLVDIPQFAGLRSTAQSPPPSAAKEVIQSLINEGVDEACNGGMTPMTTAGSLTFNGDVENVTVGKDLVGGC